MKEGKKKKYRAAGDRRRKRRDHIRNRRKVCLHTTSSVMIVNLGDRDNIIFLRVVFFLSR